jgi:N-acetylglucosaminyldiphosphoundecaprenol N-acetyl-beta-D-mannosaminyltransferase
MKNLKNINYLGVRIEYEINKENFKDIFKEIIKEDYSKIYTVNPEFVVDAFFDLEFKKELNSSSLNIIDGVGLAFGIKEKLKNNLDQTSLKSIKTFTGVDLVEELLKIADEQKLSLFLIGGSSKENIAERSIEKLKKAFPNINIIGGTSNFSYEPFDDSRTLAYIHECMRIKEVNKIDIVLVAYGHKNQEFWISRNIRKIPCRIAVGVGGTLDYISGYKKRAPSWVRNFGMEWFYRFITQPSRLFRIIKATLIFSYLSRMGK